mgnify:FL=1
MEGEKPISLREIAQIAGVSVATVSRVIHKNGRFSKETEARVREVIERYHYSPDITAQSMRTKRIPAVGILYPDLANQHLAEIVVDLEERFFDLGYATFICGTRGNAAREEAYIQLLRQHKVSGLIFLFGARVDHRAEIGPLPKVYIGRTPSYLQDLDDRTVVIETDHVHSGYMAANHLLERGCRRILFPTRRPLATNLPQGREKGFSRALIEHGIENPEAYMVIVNGFKEEHGYRSAKEWIEKGLDFDGICANNDRFAIGCMRALIEGGISIPEQVRVLGHDDTLFARYNLKRLSSIRDPLESFCDLAIDSLVSMMEGQKPEKNHYVLQGRVIRRETT